MSAEIRPISKSERLHSYFDESRFVWKSTLMIIAPTSLQLEFYSPEAFVSLSLAVIGLAIFIRWRGFAAMKIRRRGYARRRPYEIYQVFEEEP